MQGSLLKWFRKCLKVVSGFLLRLTFLNAKANAQLRLSCKKCERAQLHHLLFILWFECRCLSAGFTPKQSSNLNCGISQLNKFGNGRLWSPRCTLGISPKYIPVISAAEGYLLWWNYKFRGAENYHEVLEVHMTCPICLLMDGHSAHTSINYMI